MAGIPAGGVAAVAALGAYAGWRVLDSNLQISSDVRTLSRLSKMATLLKQHLKNNYNVGQYWEDAVANYQNKVCVKFQGRQYTFGQFDAEVNKLANWALAQGYKPGDVVSVFMENSPEFIIAYLAFAKIGIVSALINHNLRLKGLAHCISVSKSKAVFATPAIVDALAEIQAELVQNNVAVFTFGEGNTTFGSCLNEEIQKYSAASPSKDYRKGITFTDQFAYIYTSGTTGLPKAAIISHARFFVFGCSFSVGYGVTTNDICYTVLPLYHSSACLAISGMIFSGFTVVLAKKFSATNFWKEATEANATVTQYIGELCRYLVNTPPGKYDRAHKIRIAIGNGLRPDVWGTFQERFNIPEIGEFYGSTEGNASLTIHSVSSDTRGAVGRQGFLLRKLTGFKLVRFDVEKEEIIRGKDGFCIECQPGEPGEFIGPIKEDNPLSRFDGYTDKAATNKKIITDVFAKGDKYVRSGDLLMRDKRGLFYFVDRIGDTFRWKGENVSTAEVAQVISLFPGIIEANVYGVQIPGKDGRACMAGLVYQDDLQFDKFQKYCSDNLPSYAVPIFVRKLKQVDITGTFKHQKVELRKEGIDLSLVKDPIFWLNPTTKKYEPFTHDSLDLIKTGKSKL